MSARALRGHFRKMVIPLPSAGVVERPDMEISIVKVALLAYLFIRNWKFSTIGITSGRY